MSCNTFITISGIMCVDLVATPQGGCNCTGEGTEEIYDVGKQIETADGRIGILSAHKYQKIINTFPRAINGAKNVEMS